MRYLNFSPKQNLDCITKYKRYIQSYQFYEATPQRKQYIKEYGEKYREEHSYDIECICGSVIKARSMYSHIKTQKHLSYLTS